MQDERDGIKIFLFEMFELHLNRKYFLSSSFWIARHNEMIVEMSASQATGSSLLHSDWSRANHVLLSLVEMGHSFALPALLCHKEPAQGTQSPLLGEDFALRWFIMA